MGAGALWKKPDVGFGAGVKPTDSFVGLANPQYTVPDVFRRNPNPASVKKHGKLSGSTFTGARPHPAPIGQRYRYSGPANEPYAYSENWYSPGNPAPPIKSNYFDLTEGQLTADEITALKLEYDNEEALRQDKLDKMSQLAQGKGGSGGGVRGQIVGDGGDLNIQHTAMKRGKDGFPTLADFEQPLHPFMGKRKLKGLA